MRIVALLFIILSLGACAFHDPLTIALINKNDTKVERITSRNPASLHYIHTEHVGKWYEMSHYPLYYAIPIGGLGFSNESFRLMVERGAPTDKVWKRRDIDDGSWESAMDVAAAQRNIEIMQYLLDRGEQPDQTPVLHALLYRSGLDEMFDDNGDYRANRLRAVEWALDRGWSIEHEEPKTGGTPLMVAAAYDEGPLIALLLARGADPNATTATGNTPLASATLNPSHQAMKLLIDNGAEVIGVRGGEEGETLLHNAARSKSNDAARMIQLLLDAGADPNVPTTKRAYSPLAAAGMSGNHQVARVLIAAGANVHYRSPTGRTAMDTSAANMEPGDENHYQFQAVVAQAGGSFIMDSPKPRPVQRAVTVAAKPKQDNFGAALLGGLAASAVGFKHGMSEAAAVDFGASLARDIQSETVSTESFEANRYQTANQGRATAEVYAQHLSNNTANSTNYTAPAAQAAPAATVQPRAAAGSASATASSQVSQNAPTGRKLTPWPSVPQSSSTCRGQYPQGYVCGRAGSPAWYAQNHRDTAIGMARTIAFTVASTKCSGGGPNTVSTPSTPSQSDPRWIVGKPDCREAYGHTTDGTALIWCEIDVAGPCIKK